MVPSLAGSGWVAGACANKAFSCQISLLHEGEHVWSGIPAQETTSKAAVPREQEAAQTLFALFEKRGIGEKKASVAFLSKDALGLRLLP